jgi:hypothetical protein
MNHATTAAVVVLGVEAVAAAASGVGFGIAALVGHPHDRGTALFLAGLLVLFGVALAALARGIGRERHWPRTPAYLAQFFGLVVAWYQRTTLPAVSIAVAVVCVIAVVTLTRATSRER